MNKKLNEMIIQMDNTLVKKSTRFEVTEQKLFYVALASLSNGTNADNEVEINKADLLNFLGFKSDNKYYNLRSQFKKMAGKSWIEFGTDEEFIDGFLINRVRSDRHSVYVRFDDYYLPLVKELSGNYTRLLNDDVISFNSKFSMMLYQLLMKNNTFKRTILTTKQLKVLFGQTKEDYVNKSDGHFRRFEWEKFVLKVAIDEINKKSRCIKNLQFIKHKRNGVIDCYEFIFEYIDPNIAVRNIHSNNMQSFDEEVNPNQTTIDDFIAPKDDEKRVADVSNYAWWEDD